jgi:hypothetical protein
MDDMQQFAGSILMQLQLQPGYSRLASRWRRHVYAVRNAM